MVPQVLDNKSGFSTIIAVTILGAVGLSLVFTLSFLAMSSNRIKSSYYYARKADAVVNACVNKSLVDIRKNLRFSGELTTVIDGETCNYSISFLSESIRRVEAYVNVNNSVKKIRAKILIDQTKMSITDWEEVDAF